MGDKLIKALESLRNAPAAMRLTYLDSDGKEHVELCEKVPTEGGFNLKVNGKIVAFIPVDEYGVVVEQPIRTIERIEILKSAASDGKITLKGK